MNFDLSQFIPKPTKWFSTELTYEGKGRAEFLDPKGWVEGPAKIHFDETGSYHHLELEIQDYHVERFRFEKYALFEMLHGVESQQMPDGWFLRFGGPMRNTCTSLLVEVETPKGFLSSAGEKVDYFVNGWHKTIALYPRLAQFQVADAKEAKYWMLHLVNFISEFADNHPLLDRHPLRVFPTPVVPDGLPDEEESMAVFYANSRNKLIIFDFNGSPGFIEPLPEFETRQKELESGQKRSAITAVMVGEIGDKSITWDNLDEWRPLDFLHLLSLATGIDVGTPWIELRDVEGQLVQRIHSPLWQSAFAKGRAAIRENFHNGIGLLLSRLPSSLNVSQCVAIRQIIMGGFSEHDVVDRLSHLFRALDTLCKTYGCYEAVKAEPFPLDEKRKQSIKGIIKEAGKAVRDIAKAAENQGKSDEATMIRDVIAQRIFGALNVNIDPDFGKAVLALLDKYALPDGKILDDYYTSIGKKEWYKTLSEYRGQVMHQSFFRFSDGTHSREEIAKVMFHTHDILLRVMFKMLNYDHNYQPSVKRVMSVMPVDWVKPNTPAKELGY